jgi:NADPH2:quinone reductase
VIAAVSSEEKAAFARDCGADEAVVYGRDLDRDGQKAFGAALKSAAPDGIDVVCDNVGGPYAEPALRSIGWEGRFLVIGFPAGIPSIPLNLTLLKSCQVMGVFWGAAVQRDPAGHAANVSALLDMIRDGRIRPRIGQSYPLEKAADALESLERREALGKLVLTNPA